VIPKKPARRWSAFRIANVAIGIAVFAAIGITLAVMYRHRSESAQSFERHLSEYLRTPKPIDPSGEAFIRGKLVIVDPDKKAVDWTMFELDERWRAQNPEEVGTVVWLNWGTKRVGEYRSGSNKRGDAYVHTVRVTVIDKKTATIVGSIEFTGDDPPPAATGFSDQYGTKPTNKVAIYLRSLPRR
jgi:hypothetical protein